MPFRSPETHFTDILENIALIDRFLEGMTLENYRLDPKTTAAVERKLQIIAEAAYRLGPEAEALCPDQDWVGLRAMGNVLQHGYHKIDDGIVWQTVKHDLPKLKQAAAAALLACRHA